MAHKLTWSELDRCQSASEIAALLAAHGIKGCPGDADQCPLARATGWSVDGNWRWAKDRKGDYPLTEAEEKFVEDFDGHAFPELIS